MGIFKEVSQKIGHRSAEKDFALSVDAMKESKSTISDTIAHLGIAPGVIETIVRQATKEVEGVAGVGDPKVSSGIASILRRREHPDDVEILAEEDGQLTIELRIQAYYGYPLQEMANAIREAVFDALQSQVGIAVACINIMITGLQFKTE